MIFSVITIPLTNFCTLVSVTPDGASFTARSRLSYLSENGGMRGAQNEMANLHFEQTLGKFLLAKRARIGDVPFGSAR